MPRGGGHASRRQQEESRWVTRAGVVYELFFTTLPQPAFTACDVVELYLYRGAFEPTPSDEDAELDPDRWCCHAAWGQECWQVVSQWVWDLRLELGHQLHPDPLHTTEFAPALSQTQEPQLHPCGYGKPAVADTFKVGRFVSAGLHPPARWHAALSCQSATFGTRTAQGS